MSMDDYVSRGGYEGLKKALDHGRGAGGGGGEGLGASGPGRRRLPHRAQVVLHPAATPHRPSTWCATPTKASPAPSRTATSWKATPTGWWKAWPSPASRSAPARATSTAGVNITCPCCRLQNAIDQARAKGFLGDKILGTDFSFDIQVQTGGGSYVCGEETALIESIEGQRGYPRVKPPFPGQVGVWNKPTIVNNVESLSAVPDIIVKGAEWYAAKGTEDSKGTKIFQVVGHVNKPAVVECQHGPAASPAHRQVRGRRAPGPQHQGVPARRRGQRLYPGREQVNTPMEYTAMSKVPKARWARAPCWSWTTPPASSTWSNA